jgi:hypothetical protein
MDIRNQIGDRAAPCQTCDVWFIEDLVAYLRVSRATIERKRRARSFPIAELPPLDKRPRWSRKAVEAFAATSVSAERRRRAA